KDVAKRIGKNTIFVSTHLSLLKMPDCVRELYDNDITADTETLNNLRLLFELNEERCRAVCAVAMSDGMTRKQSRELLNDAKRIKNGDEPTSNEDGAVTNNSEQDNNSNSDSELGEEKGGNFTQSDVESSD
ncbi:KorB domain-containing protein, partial [Vibrio parahaemolyticus]